MNTILKMFFCFIFFSFLFFQCDIIDDKINPDSEEEIENDSLVDNEDDEDDKTENITDVFTYFNNSEFIFVIKDGISTVKTTKMTWKVSGFKEASYESAIECTLDDESISIPLPSKFYFRRSENYSLEYSSDKSTWKKLTGNATTEVNFLFGTKAAKPSSLLGSVKNEVKMMTVSYPDGSASGFKVSSEYDNSANDRYTYSDYSKEYYCSKTGFTKATIFTSDNSDYPPYTYKREVELVAYKINLPDGTIFEGGQQKPEAPSNVKASYVKNASTWNSKTGMYEKRSYVKVTWADNSKNETHFNIYMKATDNNYYLISDMVMYDGGPSFYPETFPSNTYSGSIRAGYYVNWSVGTYSIKLTAASLLEESDFSNEASFTVY